MGHGLKALAMVALLAGPTAADAASVVIGDKEWRQLTETVGFSWHDFQSVCESATWECSGSVNTVDLTGWVWASNTDVQGLFNALIPRNPQALASPYAIYSDTDVTDFFAAMSGVMFTPTLSQTDEFFTFALIQGFTRDWIYGSNGFEGYAPQLNARTPTSEPYAPYASATLSAGVEGHYSTRPFIGAWLYRSHFGISVPEPGTLALLGLGLAGLGLSRRRKV